jgi:hypothetical protein
MLTVLMFLFTFSVWESEEWLKEHVKPLAQSGGLSIFIFLYNYGFNFNSRSHLYSGVQGRLTQAEGEDEENAEENKSNGDAMEE